MPEDELDFSAGGFSLGGGRAAAENAQLDVALYAKGFVEREDSGAHGVDGDIACGGGRCDAALSMQHNIYFVFRERRQQREGNKPPGGAAAGALAGDFVAEDAAHCTEAVCAAGDETRTVDEGCACH